MKNIQDLFSELTSLNKEQKELKLIIKDSLESDINYIDSVKSYRLAKESKKLIEDKIKSDFKPEIERLEELKDKITDIKLMISDVTINNMVKGERVEVYDEHEKEYLPSLSVKFKKKK